ncbi:MAG: hypothetical protein A3G25_15795 [Betaproteobacteria bacterium RIFCSPLOWO2_12_FULL_63_13]|nr:MAG: hypothetical protein A3G25_15795 [Betaproteobacteria bacterium RIFCSPLOWO2_12_FULL_63_13]
MATDSVREADSPDVIRHLVLLGDALQNIDLGTEEIESALMPKPRNPWKLTVLQTLRTLKRGHASEIPRDATHIVISIEGAWAIEESGLLQGGTHTISEALEKLATAADEFESILDGMIAAARETGLPALLCTLVPARFAKLPQQRAITTALAIFNDRILRRAIAARLSIVDLRVVCNEDADYASETLLSRAGVRKAANVIRAALYEVSRKPGRPRVYF